MAEKTPNQQLAEKLLFKPAYVGDKSAAVKQEAHAFAEGYKKFLDAGKTEREVAAESEQMLKDAGYQQFDPKKTYAPGDKVYFSQLGKAIVASTMAPAALRTAPLVHSLTPTSPVWTCARPRCTSPTLQLLQDPLLRRHPQVPVGYHAAGDPRRVLPR